MCEREETERGWETEKEPIIVQSLKNAKVKMTNNLSKKMLQTAYYKT